MASKDPPPLEPVNLPAAIQPGASVQDIVTAFLSLSSSATPDSVVQACALITDPDARQKVFLLSLLGAIANKRVTNACVQALGVVLPAEWESKSINGEINFTNFAMLGHMVFQLPPSKTGNVVNQFRTAYAKSLGGSPDLVAFGQTGTVPGKIKRQAVLREWAGRFGSYNALSHENAIRNLFPGVYGFGASSSVTAAAAAASSTAEPTATGTRWKSAQGSTLLFLRWAAILVLGGPFVILYQAATRRRRAGLFLLMVLAQAFGLSSVTYQGACLSMSLSAGYRAASLLKRGSTALLRGGAGIVTDPTSKDVLNTVAGGIEGLAATVAPYAGEGAVRGYASKAWSSLDPSQIQDALSGASEQLTEALKTLTAEKMDGEASPRMEEDTAPWMEEDSSPPEEDATTPPEGDDDVPEDPSNPPEDQDEDDPADSDAVVDNFLMKGEDGEL